MFAVAVSRNVSNSFTSAYRKVAVETAVPDASPHALVLMLFSGFQDAVAQARGAIESGNIPAKGLAIGRALSIVGEGLESSLNLADGGDLAADLQALYAYIAARLTHANLHNDPAALEECARLMDPLRAAWVAIGARVPGASR